MAAARMVGRAGGAMPHNQGRQMSPPLLAPLPQRAGGAAGGYGATPRPPPRLCGAPRTRLERHLESVGQDGERRVFGDETGTPSCISLHGAERGPPWPHAAPTSVGLFSGRRRELGEGDHGIATPGRAR